MERVGWDRGFLPCFKDGFKGFSSMSDNVCLGEKRGILPAPTEGEIPEQGGKIITMVFFLPFTLTLNVLAVLSEGDRR